MGGDARDIELDKTLPPPAPPAPPSASPAGAPLAAGTADTEAPPLGAGGGLGSGAEPAADPRTALRFVGTRSVYVVTVVLATINLIAFLARFVLTDDPPRLHPKFLGETQGGPFEAMSLLDGPMLTLGRIAVVAAIYIAVSIWTSNHHRRDPLVQVFAATAAVAGQFSVSVAVLTSSETFVAWRVLAAVIYMALPVSALGILALFPSGRAVPRWATYCVPIAALPFAAHAVYMFVERDFSVPLAASFFAIGGVFLGFQWHRYRRHATLRERNQIKWLCYAGAAFAAIQAVAVLAIIPQLAHRDSVAFPFLKVLFELLLAASYLVGLASLLFGAARYRLWDIDRVINRTIVYALVTLLLAATFAVGFFGLRAVLDRIVDAPAISIGLALAAPLALFTPARRRIARWIDRRFYGIGLDYERLAEVAVRAARQTLPTSGTELGAYDELVLLGRGGMGAVYRAHHPDFGVPVALKVMSPQLAGDADAQARFRRESQILEGLQHPNVIPYLASGHEAGLAYIAMQWVEGEDLAAIVRRRRRLSLAEAASLLSGVAAALDVAHARGVVHRDIKPANVFIEGATTKPLAERRALVMDFGVARLDGDPSAADASLVGSLHYIAPEQIHNADEVDGRADVYALGATAYELVTGRPPFVESTALGLVLAHLHQPPADPRTLAPELPAAAANAILEALAKNRADRFATAGAFAAALATEV